MSERFTNRRAEPALLLGNGPSLQGVDLAKDTSGFHTFGMNAAYRFWREIDWWPTYYSCLDLVVGDSHISAINDMVSNSHQLGIERFLLRKDLVEQLTTPDYTRIEVYEDLIKAGSVTRLPDITTGSHTLLWAQHLGYQVILLAGVDCNYTEIVEGSEIVDGGLLVTESAENPNYFFSGYQQVGDRYNIPNPRPNLHIESWRNVANNLYPHIRILNTFGSSNVDCFAKLQTPRSSLNGHEQVATHGGRLSSFGTVDLGTLKSDHSVEEIRGAFEPTNVDATAGRWLKLLQAASTQTLHICLADRRVSLRALPTESPHDETTIYSVPIGGSPGVASLKLGVMFAQSEIVVPPLRKRIPMTIAQLVRHAGSGLPERLRQISLRENMMDFGQFYLRPRNMCLWVLGAMMILFTRGAADLHSLLALIVYSCWLPLALRGQRV